MNTKKRNIGARLGGNAAEPLPDDGAAADDSVCGGSADQKKRIQCLFRQCYQWRRGSRVYAVTIENVDGEDLHYVYSGGIASARI